MSINGSNLKKSGYIPKNKVAIVVLPDATTLTILFLFTPDSFNNSFINIFKVSSTIAALAFSMLFFFIR